MTLRTSPALPLANAAVLVLMAFLQWAPLPLAIRQGASDSFQFALALLTTAVVARAARRSSGIARSFWGLIALGTFAWTVAQGLYTLNMANFLADFLFPPWDVLFIGWPLAMLAAFLFRPDRRRAWNLGLAFDLAIFAVLSIHFFAWVSLTYAVSVDVPAYAAWAFWLNIWRDVAAPVVGIWLLRGSVPPWQPTYRLLTAALVLFCLGEMYPEVRLRAGTYEPGLLDIPWTLPFVWIGLAARRGPYEALAGVGAMVPDWVATRRGTILAVLAMVSLPLLPLVYVLGGSDPLELIRARAGLTVVTTLLVGGLLLLRQLHLLRNAESASRTEVETRQRLQRTERMSAVGMLVAGVAHELNNPLTVVLGHTEFLRRRPFEPPDPGKLEQIGEAASRCARVARNLLLFARDTGSERSPVDAADLLRRVAELEANELRVRGVRLELEAEARLPVVANAGQLQQVLVNLVTNALQAMAAKPGAGRLHLSASRTDDQAVLEVADDGLGVPPRLREEIFKPFFSTKSPGEGTGLGLAISRDIVSLHGGTLTYAEAPKGGTVFRVCLPLAPGQESGRAESLVTPLFDLRGRRVLVVDDEPSLRQVMGQMLEDAGCEVDRAEDGQAALLTLERAEVVVSDIRMPGLGGTELYARVVARHPAMRGRFVFVTGDTATRETWEFLAESGCETLQKPFSADALVLAVGRALGVGPDPPPPAKT